MQGIGELFGSAFDDVIRRPVTSLVPMITDVVVLTIGAVITAIALGEGHVVAAPRAFIEVPVAVPEALPSVTQIADMTGRVVAEGARGWLAVLAVATATLPIIAWAEGGFVGLLLETYLPRRDDPLHEPPAGLDALWETFLKHAQSAFAPMLVLRALQIAVAVAAIGLPRHVPYFRNSLLGLIVFDALFLYAPFIVVVERRRAFAALRESVRIVTDYLASTLVALLFGLLLLGGYAALVTRGLAFTGEVGLLVAAVLLAPIGTVLTLFYLKVYLSMRPGEWLPQLAEPARAPAAHTAEA